jgi:hypothetical protein
MNNSAESFLTKLHEIKELYIEVKEAIILAENFDPSNDVLLSPLTEIRNSLDHIMRSLIYTDKVDIELDEAKEHLYRAGYDAYEVLAINVAQTIVKIIEEYEVEIISSVFPKYYSEIKPNLVDIQVELGEARAHKRLNPDTGTKSFTPYKEKISTLIKQLKACQGHVPSLQSEKRKKRSKDRKALFIAISTGVLIGIIATILGTWAYDNYFKKGESKPQTNQGTSIDKGQKAK